MVASAAETAAFVPPRPPRPTALRYDTEYPLIGYAERPMIYSVGFAGSPTGPAAVEFAAACVGAAALAAGIAVGGVEDDAVGGAGVAAGAGAAAGSACAACRSGARAVSSEVGGNCCAPKVVEFTTEGSSRNFT